MEMVKIAVGERVTVDLWDDRKRRGLVKHYGDTMDLVNAESRFDLKKDDTALVIKSYFDFVEIVPLDEYTRILKGNNLSKIDIMGLSQLIYKLLKEKETICGCLLSIPDLMTEFTQTALGGILSEDDIKQAGRVSEIPLDLFKIDKTFYIALKPIECTTDKQIILTYAKNHAYITVEELQTTLGWNEIRIQRLLNYLLSIEACRKETTFRSGIRYYFQNVN
jgi:hypothetical protein